MSPAYTAAVRDHLPKATHVFDRFHVVKLFNEKFSLFRQELQREAEGPLAKKVLKGTRWLLRKNPENLDDERDERKRLEKALAPNKPLANVYYMKEDTLRQIWGQQDPRAGRGLHGRLDRPRPGVGNTDAPEVRRDAGRTPPRHPELLPMSRSRRPLGRNQQQDLQTMQRQTAHAASATHEFFKLKIFALHETRYALVG